MEHSTEKRRNRGWRHLSIAKVLTLGTSPIPSWVAFVMALFVTISAFDDVRLFIMTGPTGDHPWWVLAGTIAYLGLWMALAFLPKLAPYGFVLLLVTMYPQEAPGGAILLAFGALAVAAYRVSVRGLVVIVGAFLVWQMAWTTGISALGPAGLWGLFPATLMLVTPGLAVKFQRERSLQTARAQMAAEEVAAKAALNQRTELARELHDVVTHGLTMIAVQANLGTLSKEEGEQHRALSEIGQMARNSLDDLRRLLQTIRADDPPVLPSMEAEVAPSSATIDLGQSVADAQKRLSGLGFPTVVTTSGDLDRTPNGLRSTVLRILQESSTNVAKHSGAGTDCEISVDVHEDSLELSIRNRVTSGRPRLPVSGTGLVGLRERTSRLGGTLEAGQQRGYWTVRAVLPFKRRETLH
ncbi:Signal transduction histidine kinase [Arthrobacter alpinus]|uniref:histidine kinase n=1 Tax=Arthrobacter alpinus TaxID=656366 RepID=A0A1H5N3D9_9MICC|nr:histidine kinase [Arthrobacter alpinus]SEE95391.1 Signal transduction histidine kinase [Arthrobacter alpinus]